METKRIGPGRRAQPRTGPMSSPILTCWSSRAQCRPVGREVTKRGAPSHENEARRIGGSGHNETPRGTAASLTTPTTPEASSWYGDRCKHRSRSLGFRGPSGQDEDYGPGASGRKGLIHDFRSSRAEFRASIHSSSTGMCVSTRHGAEPRASRRLRRRRAPRSSRSAGPRSTPRPPAAARRPGPA